MKDEEITEEAMRDLPEDSASIKVSKALESLADKIHTELVEIAGQQLGFGLVVFTPEEGSRMNYISNCKREDIARAYSSLLRGWATDNPIDIPQHKLDS